MESTNERKSNVILRHAATLALVGWYLMVPPWSGPSSFDEKASLQAWEQIEAYDSANDCAHYREKTIEAVFKLGKAGLRLPSDVGKDAAAVNQRILVSRCIATDDPRLKEK